MFHAGESQTISTGDKLVHGQQGEVTGPSTIESVQGKGVGVRFPGNKGFINCYLNQVRRRRRHAAHLQLPSCPSSQPTDDVCGAWAQQVSRLPPPPLPGGYTVGEQVYITRTSHTFENGDRLEHGKQGEVVGPASAESHKGKGVAVRFPGNKDAIQCFLTSVRRGRRHAATHSSPSPEQPLLRPAHP